MKQMIGHYTCMAAAAILFSAATAGAGLTGDVNDFFFKRSAYKVVESYTDNMVLKTIGFLADHVRTLDKAANKFAESRSQKDLEAVGEALKNSFAYFNQNRVVRYGPSAFYDFDKQLATWPFDKVMVDHWVKGINLGNVKMDTARLREENTSNRGLHTVKYLVFHNDGTLRAATDISDGAVTYLAAVTGVMLEDALDYQAAWLGTENMPAGDQSRLRSAGKKIRTSYAREFKNAGEEYSRYFSVSVPLQELIGESMSVLEDMVALIRELPKYGDPEGLRYWDSVTPFNDIINQMKGVENSLVGGIKGARGNSYLDLLAKRDEALSKRIVISIAHAVKRAEVARKMNGKPLEKRELAAKLLLEEVENLTVMLMAATPLVAADAATAPFAPYGSDMN